MKAMILSRHAPIHERPLELSDLPDPEPAHGEILVRVRACAICRTDLHVIEEDLPSARLPIVPGHQGVGDTFDAMPEAPDGSILFAPLGTVVPAALRAVRKGGTVAMAGIYMSPVPEMDYDA